MRVVQRILRYKMQIQFIIYFLIYNLVHRYVTGKENATFKNVSVVSHFFTREGSNQQRTDSTHSYSNNLTEELKDTSDYKYHRLNISIKDQRIPVIYKNFLNNVDLQTVIINNCEISEIQPGFMQNTSVENLFLEFNYLETIKRDVFKGISGLKGIHLKYNSIKYIEKGAFENLPLELLDISKNDLENIPDVDFSNMSLLNLRGNKIKKINKELFNNSSLKTILLDDNLIETIEPESFKNIPNLIKISLSENKLTKLSFEIFSGFNHPLQGLDLSYNRIDYIETGAFGNSTIIELKLGYNRLTEIKNETFSGSRIEALYLDSNKIKAIEEDAFNVDNLGVISIRNNMLTVIRKGTFKKPSIKHVDIFGNKITVIEAGSLNPVNLSSLCVDESHLDDNSKNFINSLKRADITVLTS